MLVLLIISWFLLFFEVTYAVAVWKSYTRTRIKISLWYLSFLLYVLFGLGCSIEYAFFGKAGITNRWTLSILSTENVIHFSFLWLIGTLAFVIGTSTASLWRGKTRRQPIRAIGMSEEDLMIAVHLTLIIAVVSAIHMGAFHVSLNRTAAMWSGYAASFHRIDLPYRTFFIVYFTFLLFWREVIRKRTHKLLWFLHLIICILYISFCIFAEGSRLPAISFLFTYIAFQALKKKALPLKSVAFWGSVFVIAALVLYQWRGQIMSLLISRQISYLPSGRISLLQGDGGISMYVTVKAMEGLQYPPFLNFVIYLIPRFIWPTKPDPLSVAFNHIYGSGEGGFGIPMIAAGIVNFGKQLFFLQTFIAGYIVGLLDSLKYKRTSLSSVLYVTCASLFVYVVIADMGQLIAQIVWRLVMVGITFVCVRILKISNPNVDKYGVLLHEKHGN